MKTVVALGVAIFACLHVPESVTAIQAVCPTRGDTEPFRGIKKYLEKSVKTRPVPLSGTVACIDLDLLGAFPKSDGNGSAIFGPMENLITKKKDFACMRGNGDIRGVDTYVAELMVGYQCKTEVTIEGLDVCEDKKHNFDCLRATDMSSGHSLRIGTALDGRGVYGPNVATSDGLGKAATDLDACGGRFGVTPDSNGKTVYYYMLRDRLPFTIGCFGNGIKRATLAECRQAYPLTCGIGYIDVTTGYGSDVYDTDCPCYDSYGSNLPERMKTSPRPGFFPGPTKEPTASPTVAPTYVPTEETPSPTANPTQCTPCTDEPNPFLKNNNMTCSTLTFAETAGLCRKKQFTDQGYCQMTCFERRLDENLINSGFSYVYNGPSCCPRAGTFSPTPAPLPPACVPCDDRATAHMRKNNQECETYLDTFFPVVEEEAWEIFCENNRKWRERKFCARSCYSRGGGYTKNDVVEVCCE